MTSPYAWRRRLDFRLSEVTFYLRSAETNPAADEGAIGHARALWRIALTMTKFDRAAVLALET